MSSKFHVTNGVRHDGVLSPLLFNVYVNDPSECSNKSGVGRSMNETFVNHMLYADDICIISLSSSGLQRLLNICDDYCKLHEFIFNAKKSMCIYFSTTIKKTLWPSRNLSWKQCMSICSGSEISWRYHSFYYENYYRC